MTKQEQLTAIAKWFNDGGVWDDKLYVYRDLYGDIAFTDGIVKSPQVSTFTREEVEAEQERLKVEEVVLKVGDTVIVDNSIKMQLDEVAECFTEFPSTVIGFVTGVFGNEMAALEDVNGDVRCFRMDVVKKAKSKRDKWVEHAKELLGYGDEDEQFLRQLYNAGLAKMPEE